MKDENSGYHLIFLYMENTDLQGITRASTIVNNAIIPKTQHGPFFSLL